MRDTEVRDIISVLVKGYIVPQIAKLEDKEALARMLAEATAAKADSLRIISEADLIIDAINKKLDGVN